MEKIKLDKGSVAYPMPMILLGAVVEGKPNFMPVAWFSRVNMNPAMVAVAIGSHHTTNGILEQGEFSINVPSEAIVEVTDYCGLVSGEKEDKSDLFTLFYGELKHAPMINACPVTLACKVVESVTLSGSTLFVGEIVDAYASADAMTEGKVDTQKVRPFLLSMPENVYWSLGKPVGQAWSSGKGYRKS